MNTSRLSQFLMVTGIILSLSISFYVLLSTINDVQITESTIGFIYGASFIYLLLALGIYLVFKDNFNINHRPAKRKTMIAYIAFVCLGICLIYARWRFYSVPEGERIGKARIEALKK